MKTLLRFWWHHYVLEHAMFLRRHDGDHDIWWDQPCHREFRVPVRYRGGRRYRPNPDAPPL